VTAPHAAVEPARDTAMDLLGKLPEWQRDAVRRCAVPGLFDEETYDAVLRPPSGPDLAALIDAGLVEHPASGSDSCRIRPVLHDAAWAAWFPTGPGISDALRTLAEQLATWYAERSTGGTGDDDVERLRALLLVDGDAARTAFLDAFRRSAEVLDLACCHNLLAVLADPERAPFVSATLVADAARCTRELAARSVFRSALQAADPQRYLPRPTLEARLGAVLTATAPWTLRLVGAGGNGKSTMLRWLIARRCVPEHVPCALVDLDRPIDPVNATRHPWLLLLEIAHQLDEQMIGTPFLQLLREYGTYRSVLYEEDSPEARARSAALDTTAGAIDGQEVESRFHAALEDLAGPSPVVVLDTVEEAVLRTASEPGPLLALLGRLTAESPLRLVVAGRDTNTVRLVADAEVEVGRFTAEETRAYLTGVRRIRDDAIVAGIASRALGVPWQLALWADVVEVNPRLGWTALAQADPEVAWVVDRIVGRIIDPPVQWLVRYGVVPRRLSRSFAEQVLLPRIRSAVAGSDADRPALDARLQDSGALAVFGTGPAVAAQLPETPDGFVGLWARFVRYAALTSWMWLADGDPGTVELQTDVRDPIRTLLTAQPIGPLLHRDAVAYFSAAAEAATGADRTDLIGEVIYHRFCAGDPEAERYWRDEVTTARQDGLGGETIARLAGEVLGPEYRDVADPPKPGSPVIDRRTRAAAHTELAWAQCRIALRQQVPSGHATWSRVESNLAAADRFGADDESDVRRRAARAALDLVRDRTLAAMTALEELTATDDSVSVDRCIVLLLLADAQGAVRDKRAVARQTLRRAAAVAESLGVGDVSTRIVVAVSQREIDFGRLDRAAAGLDRVVRARPALAGDPELRHVRARCALDSGQPADARRFAADTDPVRVEALLPLGGAAAAVAEATDLLDGLVEPVRRAELLVVRARARARLLLVDEAAGDLATARETYGQISDAEATGRCTALAADLMLHEVGSLLDAGQYLDEAARLPLEPGSAAWVRCRLLTAELADAHGRPDDAEKVAMEALDTVVGRCSDPRLAACVAVAALRWSPDNEKRIAELLLTDLRLVNPGTARLMALTTLPWCPTLSWGRRLRKLALPMGHGKAALDGAPDTPWLHLATAELCRIAGQVDEAAELLTVATDALAGTPLAGWTWLQAQRRLEHPELPEHRAASVLPDATSFPLLAAAQRIVLAERRLAAGDRIGAAQVVPAEDAVGTATSRATEWQSRLHALRGELAVDEFAGGYSRTALLREAIQRELGHSPRAAVVESADPPGPVVADPLTVTVHGTELLVTGAGREMTLPASNELVAALHEETRTSGRSRVTGCVRRALGRREGLMPIDGFVAPGSGEIELLADARTAQLPWELATVDGTFVAASRPLRRSCDAATARRTEVRMLQESLAAAGCPPGPIDGLHGPETSAALRAFQRRSGIAPSGTAEPPTWAALRDAGRSGRPSVLVVGQDAPALSYRDRGWTTTTVSGTDLLDQVGDLPSEPVDVVHVVAAMQVTAGIPVLGLGGDTGPARSATVTCTLLDALVRKLARWGRTPLVLLDVAAQPRSGEAVRQLLLRNDLAQQVLALGQSYAVLAAGPTRVDDPDRLVAALTTKGSTTRTAAEAARLLQGDGPEPAQVLPRAATALFAAMPEERMPALAPLL